VTIFNITPMPQLSRNSRTVPAGNVDQLMRRHHGQAAALQMAGNDAGQPVDRSHIERHEGFIENPQRALFLDQPGQRDASLLALREVFAGEVFAAGEADLLQRIERVVLGEFFIGHAAAASRFSSGVSSSLMAFRWPR
jgi:hypothetical protein